MFQPEKAMLHADDASGAAAEGNLHVTLHMGRKAREKHGRRENCQPAFCSLTGPTKKSRRVN